MIFQRGADLQQAAEQICNDRGILQSDDFNDAKNRKMQSQDQLFKYLFVLQHE